MKIRSVYRVTRALIPYGSNHIVYMGLPTNNNLGDEAVYIAIQRIFQKYGYGMCPYMGKKVQSIVSSILKRNGHNKVLCVGGGTLIGQPRLLNEIRDCLNHGYMSVTFGTGVRAPEYWGKNQCYQQAIREWVELLREIPVISVRGPRSKHIMDNYGIEAEVIGDPALLFADDVICPKSGNKVIGINISRSIEKSREGKESIHCIILRLAKELLSQGWKIKLYSVSKTDDTIISEFLHELDGLATVEKYTWNVEKYVKSVRDCDIFLGMRLHSVVLALCSYTPSIMIEYQPKCADFMESMGLLDYSLDINTCNFNKLMGLFEKLLTNTEAIQGHMLECCNNYKVRIRNYVDKISKII